MAVASIVSLLLLQVQQDPVVVGGNDGLHGGTAGVANLQCLGVEYLVQLRCFRKLLLDKLEKHLLPMLVEMLLKDIYM